MMVIEKTNHFIWLEGVLEPMVFLNLFQDECASSSSSVGDISSTKACHSNLLTRGRAWAISLTLRSTLSEEISRVCFASDDDASDANLLYQFVILPDNLVLPELLPIAWLCWLTLLMGYRVPCVN
jgi:hypothetical protein